MSTLLDTNTLLRSAQPAHPHNALVRGAIDELNRQGELLYLVPQNVYEFWVVATRPAAQNGLGYTVAQTQAELARFRNLFPLLHDTPALFREWQNLVSHYQVIGKNAHDVRLVAAMLVHGLGRLLTFNVADFQRYQGIVVVSPQDILAPGHP